MALLLTISEVDKTGSVEANSLKIQNILTRRRDTASFNILTHTGDSYLPRLGEEVVIYDSSGELGAQTWDDMDEAWEDTDRTWEGTEKIFGGVIVEIESTAMAYGTVRHNIQCQDYTRLLDKRLVPDSFTDKTVDEIIAALKDLYFPEDFTINNVDAPILIQSISFKYMPLAKAIEKLADILNYDWYVDYDKDVHFFARETVLAPFNLADNDGSYRYDSLIIRRDNSQLRNSIIVRGGEYEAANYTSDIVADGAQTDFLLPYRYEGYRATLTGRVLNIGRDGVDDEDLFDAMHNRDEKFIRFRESRKPTVGSVITSGGKPLLPVIVKYNSSESIRATASAESNDNFTSDGIYEYLVVDPNITSKAAARQRAQAEILAYATTLSEGEFITEVAGLKAGQRITITSASRGIDENFVINKVEVSQFSSDTLQYHISLITTKTFDLIDVLQDLILGSLDKVQIKEGEVQDIVLAFEDEFSLTDTLGTFTTDGPPYTYATGSNDVGYNFGTYT